MFKVTREDDNKFALECHIYNKERHTNTFLYSMSNIQHMDLARALQGRIPEESVEDVLTILNLTNRPAYISDTGFVTSVSV